MDLNRLDEILDAFPNLSIAVLGDFFLDRYLEIDPALNETSLETGLKAYQVTRVRCYPGAAGTVVNNLAALGVRRLVAIGYTGVDGEAFELRSGLARRSVDLTNLLEAQDRVTPTYTKPLVIEPGGPPRELERLDIKNRTKTPVELADEIARRAKAQFDVCQGMIVADQVEEDGCGVVTDSVRAAIARLGADLPEKALLADSRRRVGRFQNAIVKPNHAEGARSLGMKLDQTSPEHMVRHVAHRTGRPALLTLGSRGVLAFDGEDVHHYPGYPHEGPVDIVGAGDSMTAGIVCALCAGATFTEAALIGNVVASITVEQIGVTGTATRDQIRERFQEYNARFPKVCGRV